MEATNKDMPSKNLETTALFREIFGRGLQRTATTVGKILITRPGTTLMAIGSGALGHSAYNAFSSGDVSRAGTHGGIALALGAGYYVCKVFRESMIYDQVIDPNDTLLDDLGNM